MKTYKHKPTGYIARQENSNSERFWILHESLPALQEHIYYIPFAIINDSKDWEQLFIPLFTSEEGIPVFIGQNCWYVNTKFELKEWKYPKHYYNAPGYKYFAKEETAKQYIVLNKPQYSLKEVIEELQKTALHRVERAWVTGKLIELKNEKTSCDTTKSI